MAIAEEEIAFLGELARALHQATLPRVERHPPHRNACRPVGVMGLHRGIGLLADDLLLRRRLTVPAAVDAQVVRVRSRRA